MQKVNSQLSFLSSVESIGVALGIERMMIKTISILEAIPH